MIWSIFTVYDEKAEAHMRPFFEQTKGTAYRAFEESCNDPSTNFFKYPKDYTLYFIGQFDDNTCEIITAMPPLALGKATEFKEGASDARETTVGNAPRLQSIPER